MDYSEIPNRAEIDLGAARLETRSATAAPEICKSQVRIYRQAEGSWLLEEHRTDADLAKSYKTFTTLDNAVRYANQIAET